VANESSRLATARRWTPTWQLGVRLILLLALPAAVVLIRPALLAQAQEQRRCFGEEAPGVTACIEGGFLSFWEENGGLEVFGYPLTDIRSVATEDGTFLAQYFERARFESHPENAPPYDIQLGRLGVELLAAQGRSVDDFAPEAPIDSCQFWVETEHNVCEPLLTTWRSAGVQLDDDPALSDAERLSLWGLPLTGQVAVTTERGVVLTQWFERARFEQQPDGSVTIGLLGAELLGTRPAVPVPPADPGPEPTPAPSQAPAPAPSAAPSAPRPGPPCDRNAPAPAEGLQVWMSDYDPDRGEDVVACSRLIVGGSVANGAQAMAYRYIGNERRPSIPQSTGLDGTVGFIFYTGESQANVTIPVEVVISYQGVTYSKFTAYTPR
jgi:hypothetical protein